MQANRSIIQFQSSLTYVQNGFCKPVGNPNYGRQHLGYAPSGAMDLFAHSTANLLLKNPREFPTLEFTIDPVIRFDKKCFFTLTGARYGSVLLYPDANREKPMQIQNGQIYLAATGARLAFFDKIQGFRTYLGIRPAESVDEDLRRRRRVGINTLFDWCDSDGRIRIVEGPEYHHLDDKEAFTRSFWKITNDFSDMGFRMSGYNSLPRVLLDTMISQAVADGTIQLAPGGPIVLLKNRQTVGGYPRIYNVISADVDLLAQYAPGQLIGFRKIGLDSARNILHRKRESLSRSVQD